jgi:hypothetical protein
VLSCVVTLALACAVKAHAFCPVCAVAAIAGLGLAQKLGIDDTISGLWLGGVLVAVTMWTLDWVERKNLKFPAYKTAITLCYWLMVFLPLYERGMIMSPFTTIWGVDKISLGMSVGALFFYFGGKWYEKIKAENGGHAYFPFQKVVMPVAPLLVFSFIFYLATRGR